MLICTYRPSSTSGAPVPVLTTPLVALVVPTLVLRGLLASVDAFATAGLTILVLDIRVISGSSVAEVAFGVVMEGRCKEGCVLRVGLRLLRSPSGMVGREVSWDSGVRTGAAATGTVAAATAAAAARSASATVAKTVS